MQDLTLKHVKKDRISIRLDHDTKRKIEQAAAMDHDRSVTSFIIASAVESADKILARGDQMVLSERDWDTFYNALTNPPEPNAALKDAFAAYKKMNIRYDV